MSDGTTKAPTSAPEARRPSLRLARYARENSTQLGIIGVFVTLWIIFIVSAPDTFLKSQIYLSFMSTVPFFAIMAIPLTLIVIAAEMDLSFPSIMAMGMVVFLLVYGATSSLA